MTPERFAAATLEEVWSAGRLVERRLSHGVALHDERGIIATDERVDDLAEACASAIDAMRVHVMDDARMRLVADATPSGVAATITLTLAGYSIVTTPGHLEEDVALVRSVVSSAATHAGADAWELPVLWKNGAGAVLLHEAAGHPAEHGHDDSVWPSWLRIDVPLALRRATFRDVPLLRMTTLTVSQNGAPFELPAERIEVLLVDGGAYEPLTDTVSLRIAAADLVRGTSVSRLAPFQLSAPRHSIAKSVVGAAGAPIRYPGVICSREGQELVVGSFAPLLLTEHG